jgi:hypothetical protein
MSTQAGLSFEQAPPFSLPLRFFLTAPLFLLAAGVLVAVFPEALASRWSGAALALTHALTLGFLAMVMLGALLQMLPVVAGVAVPASRGVAGTSHAALTLGTAALVGGFLSGATAAFAVALGLLVAGFAMFVAAAAVSLVRAAGGATVHGIRLAVAALAVAVTLGASLALLRAGGWAPPAVEATIAAHVAFSLLGWVLLLVVGVAYQVVPMFQITPPYSPALGRWLAPALFALLLVQAFAPRLPGAVALVVEAGLAAGVLAFAVATLRLQARRRRKLADVTLDFWRVGMASLIACVVVWASGVAVPAWGAHDGHAVLLGVLFLGGFAVSVVCGMLYKIVPFLAWFHLQAQLQAKAGSIPTMKQMIAERAMRWQLRLHVVACVAAAGAVAWTPLGVVAGALLAASALALGLNLLAAVRRFARHGGRFG